jgi:hypothetical protein
VKLRDSGSSYEIRLICVEYTFIRINNALLSKIVSLQKKFDFGNYIYVFYFEGNNFNKINVEQNFRFH